MASFPEYQLPLAQALLQAKLRHWDKALRELAARAAAALVPAMPGFMAGDALDELLPLCTDPVLEVGGRGGCVGWVGWGAGTARGPRVGFRWWQSNGEASSWAGVLVF